MKAKFSSPLNNIKVASPCSQDWDAMIGNERRRYCGECKLNVYNLSGMTKTEAENLILNSEGRLCVRFYRRADGSVLTEDCPVGWRAVKMRMTKMATAFASLIFGLLGGLGLNSYMKNSEEHTVGKIAPQNINANVKVEKPEVLMGDVAFPPSNMATMGNISVAPPKSENETDENWTVGKIAVPPKKDSKNSPRK